MRRRDNASIDTNAPGRVRFGCSGCNGKARACPNGWQGFSTETKRADLNETFVLQFGCAMALDSHVQLFRRHAATIVGDINTICAASAKGDHKACGASINRVLDKLFQSRSRAFNHLTRRNQINNMT